MKQESKLFVLREDGKFIEMPKEPSIDIRDFFPEIEDTIIIKGNYFKVMKKEYFNILKEKNKIANFGADGETSYITLQNIFTAKDIENKIEEICKGGKKNN